MFNKISSFILAIVMGLSFYGSALNFSLFLGSVGALIVLTFFVNLKRLGFSWPHLLLPTLFILSTGSIFMALTDSTIRTIVLLVFVLFFYLLETRLGKEGHFLQNVFLSSVFGIFLGLFATQFYFHLNNFLLVFAIFVFTYIFTVQGFAGITLPTKKYFYILISLLCAEAALGLSIWPTHFLVDSVVLFCFYYLLWLFAVSAFFGKLTAKKIYWHLSLVAILIILVLTTAAWKPLV